MSQQSVIKYAKALQTTHYQVWFGSTSKSMPKHIFQHVFNERFHGLSAARLKIATDIEDIMKVLALVGTLLLITANAANSSLVTGAAAPSKFLASQDGQTSGTPTLDMTSAAMEAALTDLMLSYPI